MARRLLEAALAETDAAENPPVSESFPSYHAFIRARIRALPPSRGPAGPVAPGGSTSKRRPWGKDRRAMLAAEFLASDEAEDLSDRSSASHCADRIIDYGCDQDFGRPLRMSPVKVETFLINWLPRKVMLSAARAGGHAARAAGLGALGRPPPRPGRTRGQPTPSTRCST